MNDKVFVSTVNFKKKLNEELAKNSDPSWNIHDNLKGLDLKTLKNIQKSQSKNLEAILLNIEGDLNVGVMIRTSSLLGFSKIHILGRPRYDRRSTVGSHVYIDIETSYLMKKDQSDIDYELVYEYIKERNLFPIICEQGGIELSPQTRDFLRNKILQKMLEDKTPCIIVGNESSGIPLEFLNKFKNNEGIVVSIPQLGVIRSFNVSSAFSIVAWEICNIL
ncbi:MAG: hypothetical protein NZZ41_01020 [Candidatus Dojkabacteria bacterium]|nr:hypothetical protein [Candidatus Dojkabacteria bacterium]